MTLFAVRTSGSGRSVNGPLTEAYTKNRNNAGETAANIDWICLQFSNSTRL